MADRDKVEGVVKSWAGISNIPNTQAGLCNVWLLGPNAKSAPCSEALEDLTERLRDAFPDRELSLTPGDFDDAIRNVDDLVAFVVDAPATVSFGMAAERAPSSALRMAGAKKLAASGKARKKPAAARAARGKAKKKAATKATRRAKATKRTKVAKMKRRR